MRRLLLLLTALLTAGCAGTAQQPQILTGEISAQTNPRCLNIFPQGKWQLVHSIDFTGGGKRQTTAMGAIVIDEDFIRAALLTMEGFTLFSAEYSTTSGLTVRRAVPPFDNPHFASGMMADIRMIFRPPAGTAVTAYDREKLICRHRADDGSITDIVLGDMICFQINDYSAEGDLLRSLTGRDCSERDGYTIARHLELQHFGASSSTFTMTLSQADRL